MSRLKSSAGPQGPKGLAYLSVAPPCGVPFCSSLPHSAWASGSQWWDILWACRSFPWLSQDLLFSLPEMCFSSLFGRHIFVHLSNSSHHLLREISLALLRFILFCTVRVWQVQAPWLASCSLGQELHVSPTLLHVCDRLQHKVARRSSVCLLFKVLLLLRTSYGALGRLAFLNYIFLSKDKNSPQIY